MSLGAGRTTIMKMVLFQSCWMSGVGLLIGTPLAVGLTIVMSHALYNLIPVEPLMFVFIMGLRVALAALSGYIPAYGASRVDPMVALRHE